MIRSKGPRIWTPIYEWYVVRSGSKNGHQTDMCSKYAKHSRSNSQHDWGELYDHLMSTKILTLIMKCKLKWAPNIKRPLTMGTDCTVGRRYLTWSSLSLTNFGIGTGEIAKEPTNDDICALEGNDCGWWIRNFRLGQYQSTVHGWI